MLSLKDLKRLDRDDLLELVGLLVGAGLGLLLAPKPGSELRNDLRDRLRSAQDALPEPLRPGATGASSAASSRSTP